MRIIAAFAMLVPLTVHADALTDLRAALAPLTATTSSHGSLEVTSTSSNGDDEKPFQGKATVGFEIGAAGLHIIYPKAMLTQANQEARAEASDPERQTPARSGLSRIRALELAEQLDAAAMLSTELLTAQLIETKPTTYQGHLARLILLKLSPKLSKSARKHVKKIDATLSVWVGDDGIPVGAERTVSVKASMLLMSFESDQKESWSFTRTGDRLVAIRHAETQKSDGFGQHNLTRIENVLRLEP